MVSIDRSPSPSRGGLGRGWGIGGTLLSVAALPAPTFADAARKAAQRLAPALRAALAAEGPPDRPLNSLRSDNATGLLPANLPRSAGQRVKKTAARGES